MLVQTASRPFLVMNPRSGGGKVQRFGLLDRARQLGAKVLVLEDPAIDLVAEVETAIDDGADLVGVAGGDGSVATVAGVAADRGVRLLVIPAGTRNHFARDLGLDPRDPASALDALVGGATRTVDLGMANERAFVNNVSFGAYAEIVERPDYREHKIRVALDALPGLLSSEQPFTVRAGDVVIAHPTVALVSNNPYAVRGLPGDAGRPRLDSGLLGLICLEVEPPGRPPLPPRPPGSVSTATRVDVEAEGATILAAVDGESLALGVPVHCRIRPGALQVQIPSAAREGPR